MSAGFHVTTFTPGGLPGTDAHRVSRTEDCLPGATHLVSHHGPAAENTAVTRATDQEDDDDRHKICPAWPVQDSPHRESIHAASPDSPSLGVVGISIPAAGARPAGEVG